ncbi:MAG: hypothetical protein NC078_08560, partial [Ruminococcus sp.]|nr:hypothetical protein [Ruminococcus sp.]
MKKLYDKNDLTFSIILIVVYCVVMGNLRGNFGESSVQMLIGLAVIGAVITVFLIRHGLAG